MKNKQVLFCILLCLLLTSCGSVKTDSSETVFWQMDSAISVKLYGEKEAIDSAFQEAGQILSLKDSLLSATQEGSPISEFNAAPAGEIIISSELIKIFRLSLMIESLTDGAFSVTVQPLLLFWQQAEANGEIDESKLADALRLTGQSHIKLTENSIIKDSDKVAVNFGGIGKGYAIDTVKSFLSSQTGISGGIISCTSNVVVFGEKPDGSAFTVAVRDPINPEDVLPFYLYPDTGTALSISGDYERFFTVDSEKYGQILNPSNGYPPDNGLRSVAVFAENAAIADALSTALTVMGEEKGRKLQESGRIAFEALFIYEDSYSYTDGFEKYMTAPGN